MNETGAFLRKDTMSEEQLTWTRLEQMGLALTYRQGAAPGWGYIWRGRSWEGPYETQMAALDAAFSSAINSLILSGQCPFRRGVCPLITPPPRSFFARDLGKDEDDENPWWYDEDREG